MNKIPKKIHYCWFGGNSLPEDAKKFINSWKKYCPDYEIIEWNESNFNININNYVKEAYHAKKWAFVSDYARLFIIYNYGGIYLDTDVELIKSIDIFLKYSAFFALESSEYINTGLGFGAIKKNKYIKKMLDEYNNIHFRIDNEKYDLTSCPVRNTKSVQNIFDKMVDKSKFEVIDDIAFFPKDYFCPIDFDTGNLNLTDNTYAIHHFSCSWFSELEKRKVKIYRKFIKKYGESKGKIIAKIIWYSMNPQLLLKKYHINK